MTRLAALRLRLDAKRHGTIRLSREEIAALLAVAEFVQEKHRAGFLPGATAALAPLLEEV